MVKSVHGLLYAVKKVFLCKYSERKMSLWLNVNLMHDTVFLFVDLHFDICLWANESDIREPVSVQTLEFSGTKDIPLVSHLNELLSMNLVNDWHALRFYVQHQLVNHLVLISWRLQSDICFDMSKNLDKIRGMASELSRNHRATTFFWSCTKFHRGCVISLRLNKCDFSFWNNISSRWVRSFPCATYFYFFDVFVIIKSKVN